MFRLSLDSQSLKNLGYGARDFFSLQSESIRHAGSSEADKSSMLVLDGRGQRSLKTCKDLSAKPPGPDKESRQQFRVQCLAQAKELQAIGKTARAVVKRMENSPNKDNVAAAMDELSTFDNGVQSLARLLNQVALDQPDIEAVVKQYEEALDFCSTCELFKERVLGPAFTLKYLIAKASCCCLYSKYDDFWGHFLTTSDTVQGLKTALGDGDEFIQPLLAEVENRVMMTLRAIQVDHLSGLGDTVPESGPVFEAYSLCIAMLEMARDYPTQDEFVPLALQPDLQVAMHVLGQAEVDVRRLSDSVNCLVTAQGNIAEHADADVSAILRFFLQHPTGQAIFELASGRVEAGKQEAQMEALLSAFDEELDQLARQADQGQEPSASASVIDAKFVPASNAWQKALQHIKAFKGKKPAMVKMFERFDSKLKTLEAQFFEDVVSISRVELGSKLSPWLSLECNASYCLKS